MAVHFVLVASPLLGPAGWRWVADELVTMGLPVAVPNLAPVDTRPPVWQAHVDAIVREIPAGVDIVLAGHSAAGRLIPLVAERTDPAATCLFVDAQLPTEATLPTPDDEWFFAYVRTLATDGMLPPWSEWWGTDAWNALIPDPNRRARLAASLPRVTLASVEEEPPPPTQWAGPGAYLRFSELFRPHADAARARGWLVDELPGEHLHLAVDPAAVAAKLVALAERAADIYGSQS